MVTGAMCGVGGYFPGACASWAEVTAWLCKRKKKPNLPFGPGLGQWHSPVKRKVRLVARNNHSGIDHSILIFCASSPCLAFSP